MNKIVIAVACGIILIAAMQVFAASNITLSISVSNSSFFPNETVPITVTVTNSDTSFVARNVILTINVSTRSYTYEIDEVKPTETVIKNITLKEFPAGDYAIYTVISYTGYFDENASVESYNAFHVRFPDMQRFPRNIVIKGFSIPADNITAGDNSSFTVEVENQGDISVNLIIELESMGAISTKEVILNPQKSSSVGLTARFVNSGLSTIEARVYVLVDGIKYLLSFSNKNVFIRESSHAKIELDKVELVDESDGKINQKDDVKLGISIKNSGSSMASSVVGILQSTDDSIEVISNVANYTVILSDKNPVTKVFEIKTKNTSTGAKILNLQLSYLDMSGNHEFALSINVNVEAGVDGFCSSDSDCASDEKCQDSSCMKIQCECGSIVNKLCVKYACCSNLDCEEGYKCDIEAHSCQPSNIIKRDVLIISSGNLEKNNEFYSSLKEYRETIGAEGLSSFYIEVDSQKVRDLFNVQPANPLDWTSIRNVIEKVLSKLEARHLLVLGGIDIVAMPEIKNDCFKGYGFDSIPTDEVYIDLDYDGLPDISVGRIATGRNDKNSVDTIIKNLRTAIKVHKSGGLRSSYKYLIGDGCLGVGGGDTPYVASELNTQIHWSPPFCSSPNNSCNYKGDMFDALKLYDIIYFATHGSGKGFGSQDKNCGPFVNTLSAKEIPQMDNAPLIMSFACFGGSIDYDAYHGDIYKDESTTVSFLSRGVANFIANTRYGLAFKKSATINIDFYKKLKEGKTVGEALKETKREMLPLRFSECERATIYEVQIYGDPTLKMSGV